MIAFRHLGIWLLLTWPLTAIGQTSSSQVYTSDITHFWEAYDSTIVHTDLTIQQDIIQRLYIDRGSKGLKSFMKARDYDAEGWVKVINAFPKFWNSLRPNTLLVQGKQAEIEAGVNKLRALYPALKPASIYFTIGALRSGGTVGFRKVLIGTEIAAADPEVDASELSKWLQNTFAAQQQENIVYLVLHEYVHTQQRIGIGKHNLLSRTLKEGSCDFIAELILEKELNSPYMTYGRKHEAEIWKDFQAEMEGKSIKKWLYNGNNVAVADLGYFVGYVICKSYYEQANDKTQAIKDIIRLKHYKRKAVERFFKQANYSPPS